jgi:hypothetical protein
MKKFFLLFAAQNIVLIIIAFFTICSLASCEDNMVEAKSICISGEKAGQHKICWIDRRLIDETNPAPDTIKGKTGTFLILEILEK